MTNKEKLANYEMMKNECFETRKLNDSLGKLVVVKNKEIKELEHENKVLAQNLEDTEIVNKALEKENAELREKLGEVQMQKAGEKSDLVWKLKTANEQKADQLTKAKDIIKNLIVYVPVDLKEYEEAKQFLKENSTYERIQKAKYNYTD